MADTVALTQLRNEVKFLATKWYIGPDTPEDGPQLIALVNNTIDDVLSWKQPYDRARMTERLEKLINDVDLFATEDREQTYRYAVRIWRASGFSNESKLFPVPDDRVLRNP